MDMAFVVFVCLNEFQKGIEMLKLMQKNRSWMMSLGVAVLLLGLMISPGMAQVNPGTGVDDCSDCHGTCANEPAIEGDQDCEANYNCQSGWDAIWGRCTNCDCERKSTENKCFCVYRE